MSKTLLTKQLVVSPSAVGAAPPEVTLHHGVAPEQASAALHLHTPVAVVTLAYSIISGGGDGW